MRGGAVVYHEVAPQWNSRLRVGCDEVVIPLEQCVCVCIFVWAALWSFPKYLKLFFNIIYPWSCTDGMGGVNTYRPQVEIHAFQDIILSIVLLAVQSVIFYRQAFVRARAELDGAAPLVSNLLQVVFGLHLFMTMVSVCTIWLSLRLYYGNTTNMFSSILPLDMYASPPPLPRGWIKTWHRSANGSLITHSTSLELRWDGFDSSGLLLLLVPYN